MSDFVKELTQGAAPKAKEESSEYGERETKLLGAYKNAAKIKSSSAQRVFLDKFIPQMESQLGLVDFVGEDIKEIVKNDPLQATNIVELMKNAQRKMKAEAVEKKAFNPSDEPLHVGRVHSQFDLEIPETRSARQISQSNARVNAAVKLIKARVKDLSRLKGPALDILRAILSDSFDDREIEQAFYLLGVR